MLKFCGSNVDQIAGRKVLAYRQLSGALEPTGECGQHNLLVSATGAGNSGSARELRLHHLPK